MGKRWWVIAVAAVAMFAGTWLVLHERQPAERRLSRPPARGEVAIPSADVWQRTSGRVVGLSGPIVGIKVIATAEMPDSLSQQPCPDGQLDHLLQYGCAREDIAKRIDETLLSGKGGVVVLGAATTDGLGGFEFGQLGAPDIALWAESPTGSGALVHVHSGEQSLEIPFRLERGFVGA